MHNPLNLMTALAGIKRHFIGGFGTAKYRDDSKYKPHQGKQECARRVENADRLFFKDTQTGRNPYTRTRG